VQTQPDHQAEGSRITVAASKAQGIVQLQEVRHSHGFPASQKAVSGLAVSFAPLRFDIDLVSGYVDHVEGIESAVALDVTRT
jgi:hypothetical protein